MVLVFAGESHKDDEITRLCAELAAVTAERDDFAEQLALRSESGMAKDMQEIMRINNELVAERDALAARLAPVDDEALVDIAAETWIEATTGLARRPSAYTISERAGARAAIAAIRPHIEAAERERCAKIADKHEHVWHSELAHPCARAIAAAIRSGK